MVLRSEKRQMKEDERGVGYTAYSVRVLHSYRSHPVLTNEKAHSFVGITSAFPDKEFGFRESGS